MNLDLTRQTFLQALTFSLLVVAMYWSVFFVGGYHNIDDVIITKGITSLGMSIDRMFTPGSMMRWVITILFQLFNIVLISLIFIRNVIHIKKSHITSLIYVIVSCGLLYRGHGLIPTFATFLVLQGIRMSYKYKKLVVSARMSFLSSFIISSASLIYWPAYLGYIVIFARMIVYRRFYTREIFSIIIGLVFPIFLVSYVVWLFGENFLFYIFRFGETIVNDFSIITYTDVLSLSLPTVIFVGVLLFAAISLIFKYIGSEEKRLRIKNSIIVFWSFLISCGLFLSLFIDISNSIIPILSIPLSLLISLYFNININKKSSNIVFVLMILMLLVLITLKGEITIYDCIEFFKSLK